jgi:OmpA-OmpF porin, OOP family
MRRGWRLSLAALAIFAVAGCAGFDYSGAKSMKPGGTPFDQALFKEYLAQSKSEYDQANYTSSDLWAGKATAAAKGQTPKPTQISDWRLPSAVTPEMTTARQRLQAALDKNGGSIAPNEMAKAQVGFDCWCEQQRVEENFQPDDIAHCRQMFYDNIAKVEAAMAPKPAAKVEPVKDFMVFFDWNKATLTPEARKIIADSVAQAKASGAKQVKVVGFTDTSGSPAYNMRLSVRRAEAVKAEMVRLGVPANVVSVEGRGQNDLLVPTKDNVREPQNRRATIGFPKMGASLSPANDDREMAYIQFVH